MTVDTTTLSADRVGVAFSGLRALHEVSLTLAPGQVVGLIGPNGAGKTTLVNVLSGFLAPTQGAVLLGDRPLGATADPDPSQFRRNGVARTFQGGRLFRALSVREQLEVAGIGLGQSRRSARIEAEDILDRLDLRAVALRRAGDLPYSDERRVGIARALMGRPRHLLLDEPAAGMGEADARALQQLIHAIVQHLGCSVLLIEHNVRMVADTCDTLVVLDAGQVIATGDPAGVLASTRVRQAYLGSAAQEISA